MLSIQGVSRTFGDTVALHNITLEVSERELICLLGPSGCGKTTLLHVIAGLDEAFSGDILLDGESVKGVPVHQRDFGLMFQDFALFPHMTVAENILFGLKMQGVERSKRESRLQDVLNLVGMSGYEAREVTQLSGGEKQRVALARSLAPQPCLLMLDEPLGSLDAALRKRLMLELREIIKRIGLTSIYVTHDQEEAFAMGDRIVIMNAGYVEQAGTPEEVYRRPASVFVARFLGLENIIPVSHRDNGTIFTPIGAFLCEEDAKHVLIHPSGIQISDAGENNTVQVIVKERIFNGESYTLRVQTENNVSLRFKVPTLQNDSPDIHDCLQLSIAPPAVVPLK